MNNIWPFKLKILSDITCTRLHWCLRLTQLINVQFQQRRAIYATSKNTRIHKEYTSKVQLHNKQEQDRKGKVSVSAN